MLRIGFIGAGTIGSALALALDTKGYPVASVASRQPTSAVSLAEALDGCAAADSQGVADAADLVFITTPDDAIAPVAAEQPSMASARLSAEVGRRLATLATG